MLRPLTLRFSLAVVTLLTIIVGARLTMGRSTQQTRVLFPALGGDAALIMLANGRTILVDGGADGAATATWLGNTLPFGQRRIDVVVLSRATASTLPGQLAALKRYEIGMALIPPPERRNSALDAWWQLLEQQRTPIHTLTTDDQIALEQCVLRVINEYEGRAAFALNCGATAVYFLQALDDDGEAALETGQYPPATLVVYPWQRETDVPLLRALQPRAIVFSENEDGDVTQSWAERQVGKAVLYHEAINGQIELVDDGQRTTITVEQGE